MHYKLQFKYRNDLQQSLKVNTRPNDNGSYVAIQATSGSYYHMLMSF